MIEGFRISLRDRGWAALLTAAAMGLLPVAASAADIVPHQAIYSLRLAEVHSSSNFNGVSGAAVSLIERTCEGWAVDEQVVMNMSTNVGGAINREMTFKATESFDGKSFRFNSVNVTNGDVEAFKGSAKVRGDGSAEAEFITPRPFEMPLSGDVHFYIGTTSWLIDLAKSGAKTGETFTFDGSDTDGAQKMTAFILPDKRKHPELKGDPELLKGQAWNVRLAFFKTKGQASKPEFEIEVRLLENGVITNYRLIFDDLTVDQVLDDLLPAKDEKCG